MLPRHVRSVVLSAAAKRQIQASLKASRTFHTPFRIAVARASSSGARSLHSSSRRQNELPKSPFQTFVDTLKEELQKSRELQQNVKQLQGDVDRFQDSEAMKKAREAYERARVSLQSSRCDEIYNACLACSLPQVSRRTLDYELRQTSYVSRG